MLKKLYELKKLHEKKGKKGFSMIELIIVIAIMAILVALIGTQLIPYLEKSREKRDMTTLETCKTAFESVIADNEIALDFATKQTFKIADLGSDHVNEFYEYAGLSSNDEPFKSDIANPNNSKSKASDVEFIYKKSNSSYVLTTVKVGTCEINTITTKATQAPQAPGGGN